MSLPEWKVVYEATIKGETVKVGGETIRGRRTVIPHRGQATKPFDEANDKFWLSNQVGEFATTAIRGQMDELEIHIVVKRVK